MSGILILEQALNGLQFGLMLFLLAAGLTLVFGIMDMINLAHGSLYMVGAYLMAAVVAGDRLVRRGGSSLRGRRHGADRHAAGSRAAAAPVPARPSDPGARDVRADPDRQRARAARLRLAAGPAQHAGGALRAGRAAARAVLFVVPPADHRGRAGGRRRSSTSWSRRRAPACWSAPAPRTARWRSPWASTSARCSPIVFGVGAALCAIAGAMLGPILAVQVGMGESILILAFVVIVIGGIGSIRGALVGVAAGRHRRHDRARVPAGRSSASSCRRPTRPTSARRWRRSSSTC